MVKLSKRKNVYTKTITRLGFFIDRLKKMIIMCVQLIKTQDGTKKNLSSEKSAQEVENVRFEKNRKLKQKKITLI